MIEIVEGPIDHADVTDRVRSKRAGAICAFLGTTRELTGERRTVALEYEAHGPMAKRQLARLEAEARERWPLIEVAIVHRIGRVDAGEISVVVAVSSPHRAAAFEACEWLMDMLKRDVPIWKRESWADGTEEWVHPGLGPTN
jgi:molybdopterin synthase catalytic subunit